MTTIITLMWGTAWERYGAEFVRTFDKYWPQDVNLLVVADRDLPLPRGRVLPLSDVRGYADFQARWKNDKRANGYAKHRKVDGKGYSWRHDAVKWSGQCMAPELAVRNCPDGEVIIWFDADVVAYKPVPPSLPAELLDKANLAYLGRGARHSELGYWSIRANEQTRKMVTEMADIYRSDRVFEFKEWHSAYIFDVARRSYISSGGPARDLTPGGRGHVWFRTPLGRFTDHLKGKRKELGTSPERRKCRA